MGSTGKKNVVALVVLVLVGPATRLKAFNKDINYECDPPATRLRPARDPPPDRPADPPADPPADLHADLPDDPPAD
eukprot:2908886-Karenia_brevis.AAC.1